MLCPMVRSFLRAPRFAVEFALALPIATANAVLDGIFGEPEPFDYTFIPDPPCPFGGSGLEGCEVPTCPIC